MLGKGTDFSEESVEKSWAKESSNESEPRESELVTNGRQPTWASSSIGIHIVEEYKEVPEVIDVEIGVTYNLEAKTYFFTLDYQRFEVNADLLHDALQITPKDSDHPFVTPLPHDDIVSFINKLGYPEDLEQVSKMVINSMYQPWRTFMTMINKCLTRKASGFNRPSLDLLKVLWGMVTKTNVDYANLTGIVSERYLIDSRQISAKKKELLPFPRFTKLIIKHIISLHNNLSERPQSYHHVIKLDAILGNLKFANKGENDPIYGMAIPMEAMSDEIKASTDYSNYLAKSKVDKPVKGKGKGLMTRKGIQVRRESDEGTLDHSKKLKGVETISDVARYLIDMKTVTKESKNDYILQRRPKGQGEGFGVIPEDPDGPSDSSDKPVEAESNNNSPKHNHKNEAKTKIILKKSKKPEEKVDVVVVLQRLIKLEKMVATISKIDHIEAIEESVQGNVTNEVKNQLSKFIPKAVSEFVQPRMESMVHDVLKITLITLYQTPSTFADSLTEVLLPMQSKTQRKRKEKMLYNSSSKKGKTQSKSSKEAKAPTKPLATYKAVEDEELIQDNVEDDDEMLQDDDMAVDDMPHDDDALTQEWSKWFKQDAVVRLETSDPEWYKELIADDARLMIS
ncbi:hypothetical protein Tco_0149767 [Tanacetum coccineum]